jgi:AraC-like DNA-binding protein
MVNFDGSDARFLLDAAGFAPETPLYNFKTYNSNEVLQILTGFYRFKGQELYHGIMATTMLYMLMGIFVKTSMDENPPVIPKSWTSSVHFNKAMEFIAANYTRGITVEEIASHVNLSRSRLYRIFNQQLSMSPHQYLTQVRIAEACRILEKRSGTIKEAAQAVGIDDPLYFSTLFKKHTGLSPSQFIKKLS